jgi:hypothetical protein
LLAGDKEMVKALEGSKKKVGGERRKAKEKGVVWDVVPWDDVC